MTYVYRVVHVSYYKSDEDVDDFKPEEYFDTPSELLGRKFNRPTLDKLENGTIIANAGEVSGDPTDLAATGKHESQVVLLYFILLLM